MGGGRIDGAVLYGGDGSVFLNLLDPNPGSALATGPLNLALDAIRDGYCKGDGATNDAAGLNQMILDCISKGKPGYVPLPSVSYYLGTDTVNFPHTMPLGFQFVCHPGAKWVYAGTGDAVNIDSNALCDIRFGWIEGPGGSAATTGLHFQPRNTGANGQKTVVVSRFAVNNLTGFSTLIHYDCASGSFANSVCDVLTATNGQGTASTTIASKGVVVDGASPQIFQGNTTRILYLKNDLSSGTASLALAIGTSSFGASLINANAWACGIDGQNNSASTAVDTYGSSDVYSGGPPVDLNKGVILEIGATSNTFLWPEISATTPITDNSGGANSFYFGDTPYLGGFALGTDGLLRVFNTGDQLAVWRKTDGVAQIILNKGNTAAVHGFSNNPGFTPSSVPLPSGTGSTNKVTNNQGYDCFVYQTGQSGTHIVDGNGVDLAVYGDPPFFYLPVGASVYYSTTVPTGWYWFGM